MANGLDDILDEMAGRGADRQPDIDAQAARHAVSLVATGNPDTDAILQRASRRLGAPIDSVKADPDRALLMDKVESRDWRHLATTAPKTTRLLGDTSRAAIAHDDIDTLSRIEQMAKAPFAWLANKIDSAIMNDKPLAPNLGNDLRVSRRELANPDTYARNFAAGGKQAAGSALIELGRWRQGSALDPLRRGDWMSASALAGARISDAAYGWLTGDTRDQAALDIERGRGMLRRAKAETPRTEGTISGGVFSAVQSLPTTLAALATTYATRNPLAGARVAGLLTEGQSYGEALNDNVDPETADQKAAIDGIIEMATEVLPEKFLLGGIEGKGFRNFLLSEVGGEQLATLGQDYNQWAQIDRNRGKTFAQYQAEIGPHALQTLIASAVTSGVMTGAGNVVQHLDRASGRMARRQLQAQQAQAVQEHLANLQQLASASKLRERDTTSFQSFLADATEDTPIEDIYVAPDKLGEVLNQSGLDEEQQKAVAEAIGPRLAEAVRQGTDVRIPTAEFTTLLAGTPAEKQILEHAKVDPNGMTKAEAEEWMQTEGDQLRQEIAQAVTKATADEESAQHFDAVKSSILEQLNSARRFTPAVNEAYASMMAEVYATMAHRSNMPVQDLWARMPVRVQAQAVMGDTFDQSGNPALDKDRAAWAARLGDVANGKLSGEKMIRAGRTPAVLRAMGLDKGNLAMRASKIGKTWNKHATIPADVWNRLPELLHDPVMVVPNKDGGFVAVLDARDGKGNPIVVPVGPAGEGGNVVFTVFGKDTDEHTGETGDAFLKRMAEAALKRGETVYLREVARRQAKSEDGVALGVETSSSASERASPAHPAHKLVERPVGAKGRILTRSDIVNDFGENFYQSDQVFYSALERAVADTKTARASGEQWLATLSKTPGVKKEELEWTGLPEWLKAQEGPVSRDEVLAFVREGGVQVEEVVLGETDEEAIAQRDDELREEWVQEQLDNWEAPDFIDYERASIEESDWDEDGDPIEWTVGGDTFGDLDAAEEAAEEKNMEARDYAEEEWRREAEESLRDRAPDFSEQAQRELGDGGTPKFGGYTEDGGEDYRELLLTLPPGVGGNPEKGYYHSGHFSDQPVIAHIRFKTRKSADGKDIMFLEEVQSDWHQQGREKGYQQPVDLVKRAELRDAADQTAIAWNKSRDDLNGRALDFAKAAAAARPTETTELGETVVLWQASGRLSMIQNGEHAAQFLARHYPEEWSDKARQFAGGVARNDVLYAAYKEAQDALDAFENAQNYGIPDAPFKSTPAWAGLAMKRAIRWAADNGFDQIAWTTGEQQAERYNQLMTLESVRVTPLREEGRYEVNPGDSRIARLIVEQGKGTGDTTDITMTAAQIREVFGADLGGRMVKLADDAVGQEALDAHEAALAELRAAQNAYDDALAAALTGEADTTDEADQRVRKAKRAERDARHAAYPDVVMSGDDLKLGGEGMKGFYDKMLPNITKDIIKKHGSAVRPLNVSGMPGGDTPEVRAARAALDAAGASLPHFNGDRSPAAYTADSAERLAEYFDKMGSPDKAAALRGVDPSAYDNYQAAYDAWVAATNAVGTNLGFDITPELKAAANSGFALFQKERGAYSPATDTITLLQHADLSTFLHESGHFFLEMLHRLATDPAAPQQVQDDWKTTLKWFGVSEADWQGYSLEQKRASHEKWARGFEAYLFTGKAPSLRLQSIFGRFRAWLMRVYTYAKNLGVQPTPEIRQVFDRMLATDQQIAEAEAARSMLPLFEDQKSSGMDPLQWAEYQRQAQDATAEAISELESRGLRDMQWLTNAKGREIARLKRKSAAIRKQTRKEVAAEVMAEPVYAARLFLTKGLIDGEKSDGPHRLSIPEVDALYGDTPALKTIKDALGYGAYGMLSAENGLHPEQVAELFGFTSADHLIREVMAAEDMNDKIDALTEKRLLEEHGDLNDEQAIEDAANKAIHSEARAKFVATELAALDKATGKTKILAKAARQFAEETIARLKVRDLRPALYEAAAARAGKAAQAALAKGETRTAAAEKRNQLINIHSAKAALKAKEEIGRSVEYLKKFERPGVRKNMRGEYLEQLDALLGRFDLRTSRSLRAIDNDRAPLAKWVADEAERLSAVMPILPDFLLNEGYRTHYRNLTIEELRGLVDGVKQLEFLARRENKQYLAIKEQSFEEERDALLGRIREVYPEAFNVTGDPFAQMPDFVPSIAKTVKQIGDKFAGEMLSAETITSILDGGTIGPVYDSLFSRLSKRSDWKAQRLGGILKKLQPHFKAYSIKEKLAFSRRGIFVPEINTSVTRENALVVALLAGSEDGRARLANYGWADTEVQAIVDLLDERDWQLADAIWRLFDEDLWPELEALNRRTTGTTPAKVEALPYRTKFGTMARGGYFRLKYDTDLDERAYRLDEGAAVKELLGNSSGMNAKTGQGTSIERIDNVTLRPRLDFGVFAETVAETIHDIAYREAVADTWRILNDKRVTNALKNTVGTPAYRALLTRVREVAAPPRNPSGFVEKSLSVMRRNAVINMMSGMKTALQNLTGLVPAFGRVKAPYLVAETARMFTPQLVERYNFPAEQSDYMKARRESFDRDLSAQANKLTIKGRLAPDTGWFLWFMSSVDKVVASVVWNAAYKEGLAVHRNDHGRAVEHADHIVRQTQGSGRDVDLPRIMSGHGGWGELKKVFTMFSSYMVSQGNALARAKAVAKQRNETRTGAAAEYAGKFMLIVALPAILTELLFGAEPPDDEEPDEKARRYARAVVMYRSGMVPLVRDFSPSLWASFDDQAPDYGVRLTPLQGAAEGIVKGVRGGTDIAEGEGDMRDVKNLILGVGYATGTPGKLVSDVTTGADAWLTGDAGPEAVLLGPPKVAHR